MINTVLGTIDKEELGKTLCHEHIIINLSGVRKDSDSILSDVGEMSKEVILAKEVGISSMIEVTNIGMGRDVKKLKEISQNSKVNIIASTGFYTTNFYPDYIYTKDCEELAKIMIEEIEVGIENTNIRAGVIGEIGTTDTFTNEALKVFDAACIAHEKTNVAIFTHCQRGTLAKEQVEYFIKKNINLDKIVIGHMDLNTDIEIIIDILKSGVNIAFDTIGKENYIPNKNKAEFIAELVTLGYEDKILLSQDITRLSYLKKAGSIGYVEVAENFVPMLLKEGISTAVIDKMLIHNPARILEI